MRNDIQFQDRGVAGVVKYFLMGDAQLDGGGQRCACPGVAVKARVGPAGNLKPDAVAAAEAVGCRPQLDVDGPDSFGVGTGVSGVQADDPVTDVE